MRLHCGIDFDVNERTAIFEDTNPFGEDRGEVIGFRAPKCDAFDFKTVGVVVEAEEYAEYMRR